jgi:hypothetical protein
LPEGWGAEAFEALCRELEHKRWNVRICERYQNPTGVLNYLGRYLHGGPIGESRLVAFDGEKVDFRYKDYRDMGPDGPREKTTSLPCHEFIRRFLQHVPPKGLHMVRGYGLYRRGGSTEELRQRVRSALPISPDLHAALTSWAPAGAHPLPGECPRCGMALHLVVYAPRGSELIRLVYPARRAPPAAVAA